MPTFLDFETTSEVDIKTAGAAPYVRDASTDVICMSYAVDDGPVMTWRPGQDLPELPTPFVAHNAAFDRGIWQEVMVPKYGAKPVDSWKCSSSRAASAGLPRSLELACAAVGLEGKDLSGSRVMLKYAKDPSLEIPAEDLKTIVIYCERDVEATRELWEQLPSMGASEVAASDLDWRINENGIPVDVESCRNAVAAVLRMKDNANLEVARITGGAATTINQRAKILTWAESMGYALPDLRAETVRDALTQELPAEVKELLELRQSVGLSSLSKFSALLSRVCQDGRIRGSHLFYGAHTGRWSSRGAQFQNIPRGDSDKPEELISQLNAGAPLTGKELQSIIRGMVKAPEGSTFAVVDFGQIEARVLAWVAGQADLLEQFENDEDIYLAFAEKLDNGSRQIAKACVLGFGYGMGHHKFQQTLAAQGTQIGLEEAERLKNIYRETNDKIVDFWRRCQGAFKLAVEKPGSYQTITRGMSVFMTSGRLRIQLPSKRHLYYENPELVDGELGYYTTSSVTRKFERVKTYGGKICENIVQAIARDVLLEAMAELEANGFTIVMHVHDEVVVETAEGNLDRIVNIMESRPSWCPDLPLTADGFESRRFKK